MHLSTAQQREIQETLDQIGLSLMEQKAYLALLERGVMTATPLAEALEIPLTTTQSLLKRLAERGVVHVTKHKSRSVYEAKDPIVFKNLLEQTLQDLGGVIPLLRTLRTEQIAPARIRIYQRERMTDVFRQALHSKEKMIYELASARDMQEILGERFHFSKRRIAQGVHLKSLRVESQEIKKYNSQIDARELREAKFLPKEFTFTASIMMWDSTIAFFAASGEGLAWTVQSKSLVLLFRQMFELLWSLGHRMDA